MRQWLWAILLMLALLGSGCSHDGINGDGAIDDALGSWDQGADCFDCSGNHPPKASDLTLVISVRGKLQIQLVAQDPDGDALTFALEGEPALGKIEDFEPQTGRFTYLAGAETTGEESLRFTASDGALTSEAATVTITIQRVNFTGRWKATNVQGARIALGVGLKCEDGPVIIEHTEEALVVQSHGFSCIRQEPYSPPASVGFSDKYFFPVDDKLLCCSGLCDETCEAPALELGSIDASSFSYSNCISSGSCHTFSLTPGGDTPGVFILVERCSQFKGCDFTINAMLQRDDLRLESFTVATNTMFGNRVISSFTVCNDGGSPAPPFEVGVYYNVTTAPGCGAQPDATLTIDNLNAGVCLTRGHHWQSAESSAGNPFTAWAVVDPGCQVIEGVEDNNSAQHTYEITPAAEVPDLHLSAFDVTVNGTTLDTQITVCNQGGSTANPETVGLFYNRVAAPSCDSVPDEELPLVSLGPGQCEVYSATQDHVGLSGTFDAWALVDPSCKVHESDETNNHRSASYSIDSGALPDLYIKRVHAEAHGPDVEVEAQVCNSGGPVTEPFQVGLLLPFSGHPECNEAAKQQWTVPSFASGACTTFNYTAQDQLGSGPLLAKVYADLSCVIDESSNFNNYDSDSYRLGEPYADLYVKDFTAQVVDQVVHFSFYICNAGTTEISSHEVHLNYLHDGPPRCDKRSSSDMIWSASKIRKNACQLYTHSWDAGGMQGTFTAWASASCVLSEDRVINNHGYANFALN